MAVQRTAPRRPLTEQRKARARLPLLILVALVCPPLAGVRSTIIWASYFLFVLLYSLWARRLCAHFAHDRRLGYLFCLTDLAILFPLLVWSSSAAIRAILILICAVGLGVTYLGSRIEQSAGQHSFAQKALADPAQTRSADANTGAPLERAVRLRLGVFRATGSRFALVMLRVLRFDEAASYYGEESSQRIIAAVSRRGLRMLGPDAQHFPLPGGRVAFLFEIDPGRPAGGSRSAGWADPTDIESLAMALGRKACEHLVDGHRVECVVGWASAPSDGLNADDLLYVAEAGAQSTAAFRRVAGQVTVSDKARVAAG